MLTLKQLQYMRPGTVFAAGEVENSPDGVFMTNENIGKQMMWVAKRGGIEDWVIYIHWAEKGLQFVVSNGDKVTSEKHIKKLVPCDDEAFKNYRF